jgi:hypothetical protein
MDPERRLRGQTQDAPSMKMASTQMAKLRLRKRRWLSIPSFLINVWCTIKDTMAMPAMVRVAMQCALDHRY